MTHAQAPAPPPPWRVGARDLDLRRPLIMGVVNVTPDSFSDGGRFLNPHAALTHALQLLDQGADILDVGGESTRPGAADVSDPGAADVSDEEELRRVLPVVEAIRAARPDALLSIDTRKASVAAPCLAAGAQIINDVSGLSHDPDMPRVVAAAGASLVLMHMRGTPATMLHDTRYDDLFDAVTAHLRWGLDQAQAAGISPERVALDPGIGFAKDLGQNLSLIANLRRLTALGRPLLLGVSRKRFIGALTGKDDPADRAFGTAAAVAACVLNGASILRVHDVAQCLDAVKVAAAIRDAACG